MSDIIGKKISVAFGLLSFAILFFGSIWSGARIFTGFLRGLEGGLLFGVLIWGLSYFIVEKEGGLELPLPKESEANKGTKLDDTA